MIDKPDFLPLNKKYFKLMLVRRITFFLVLIVSAIVFYLVNKDKDIPFSVFVTSGVALFLFGLIYILLTRIIFNRKKYLVHDTYLSYKKGLLINQMTVVPFSRIQQYLYGR